MEDPKDRDLTYTALRETYEEIGLPTDRVDVWGQMQPSPSKVWYIVLSHICNILQILIVVKMTIVRCKNHDIFFYFCSKHRLSVQIKEYPQFMF